MDWALHSDELLNDFNPHHLFGWIKFKNELVITFKTKLENIITLILFPLDQLSIEKNRLGFTWNLNSSETWVLTHECYAWMYIQREYLYERLHRTIHSECTFHSVTKIWQLLRPDEFYFAWIHIFKLFHFFLLFWSSNVGWVFISKVWNPNLLI